MRLGILVNTPDNADDVRGITDAAIKAGHEVTIFIMDEGIKLLSDTSVSGMAGTEGVAMSFCDHNAQQFELNKGSLPESIVCGSQYNNAVMGNESDKLIVL